MPQRVILALTPQELERGDLPDPEVDGVFGGVEFTEGVSEPVRYQTAATFAARGNAVLEPEEAERRLEENRSEGEPEEESEGVDAPTIAQRLTPSALETKALPDDADLPGYQKMLSDLKDLGVDLHDFFGGQPTKEPLQKMYLAATEGPDALINIGD